jgi:alanine racemase
MPLTLHVDGARWERHLARVRDAHPGIVPVLKGNGYGFGVGRLAERATWLGVDTVAVGACEPGAPRRPHRRQARRPRGAVRAGPGR